MAISDDTIRTVMKAVVDNLKFEHIGDSTFGPITLHFDVAAHFPDNATNHPWLDLRDDGTVYLHDLEVLFDKLEVTIGVDIPEWCIGGFCIFWVPIYGCVAHAPELCLFSANPDFSFNLALDKFVTTKLSVEGAFQTDHWNNPARQPADSDWDAHANGRANQWRLALKPRVVHWEPIALADTAGNLFDVAIKDNIDNLISGAPDWAKSLIDAFLGGIDTLIRDTLGLGSNLTQWLEEKFNAPFGLLDILETVAADYFANKSPITMTEDPVPILEDKTNPAALIPIMVPVASLAVQVNAKELVLEGSLG